MSGEIIYFGVAGKEKPPLEQGEAFPKPLARDQKGNCPIYPGGLSGIVDREDLVHKHLLCTSEAFTPVHPPQFEDQNREEAAAAAGVPEPEPDAPLLRLPLAFRQRTKKTLQIQGGDDSNRAD